MKPDLIDTPQFAAVSEAQWKALAGKALKGADFDAALVSTSDDGIRFGPLGGRARDGAVHARQRPDMPWVVSQRVDDPDGARMATQAAADLDGGARGLTLCLPGAASAHEIRDR